MEFKDFVLALFQDGKKPTELENIRPIKKLDEVHDLVTLYFIDKHVKTVSALEIEEYLRINAEMGAIVKGRWVLGGYNDEKKCFYSMGEHPVTRLQPKATMVTQKRLDDEEVYVKDPLDMFSSE